MRGAVARRAPELRVRRSYPYLGKTDGHATFLRRKYPTTSYVGVELEVNQALLSGADAQRDQVLAVLSDSLAKPLRGGRTCESSHVDAPRGDGSQRQR